MTNIYAFRDKKVNFCLPFCQPSDDVAIRAFEVCLTDPQSQAAKWPDDIDLYRLGTYDEVTGVIVPGVEFIASGTDCKRGGRLNDIQNGL